jgi:hypothetical protein
MLSEEEEDEDEEIYGGDVGPDNDTDLDMMNFFLRPYDLQYYSTLRIRIGKPSALRLNEDRAEASI